jgi:hypothetical protein
MASRGPYLVVYGYCYSADRELCLIARHFGGHALPLPSSWVIQDRRQFWVETPMCRLMALEGLPQLIESSPRVEQQFGMPS